MAIQKAKVSLLWSSSGSESCESLILIFLFIISNEALNISEGIDSPGMIQWDLFGCLVVAWVIVYAVIWKGLHNSGKVYNGKEG